jgi:hypothetical protein
LFRSDPDDDELERWTVDAASCPHTGSAFNLSQDRIAPHCTQCHGKVSVVRFSTAGTEYAIPGRAGEFVCAAATLIADLETAVHRVTEHVKLQTATDRKASRPAAGDAPLGDSGTPAEFFTTIEDLLRSGAVGAACVAFYNISDSSYIVRYVST